MTFGARPTVPVKRGTLAVLAIRVGRVSRGTNRTAGQKVYADTAGRAGVANSRARYATAAQQVAEQEPTPYQAGAPTRGVAEPR